MYTVSKSIRITRAADGALLLAIEAGKVLRLNPTGLLILEHLQNGATEDEIIEVMAEQFNIAHEIARADISEFLQQLQALGITKKAVATNGTAVHACNGCLS